jgi:antitoxin (DNA-binding transcriptional repressor) of toxin-antitoxin stability system
MDIYTVKEYQERFDELMERVEKGETIGIVDEEGRASVMIPYNTLDDDLKDLIKIYSDHDEAS